MRIAQLSPLSTPVSPMADGFVQRSIALLADGLVEVGEDVALVASEGSLTHARLVSTPLDDRSDPDVIFEHLTAARARIGEVDVIHDHTDLRILLAALNGHPGIVHTLRNGARLGPLPDDVDRVNVVATTWSQVRRHPGVEFVAVIPDGIRISDHPLIRHRDERIAYVGPARADDGPQMAIAVAERLGLELVLALSMEDEAEAVYWRETLAPILKDAGVRVRLMSVPTDRTERQAVLGRVRGMIVPPPLDDGLAHLALEAGAVGTPVIAFDGDGVDEFVEDGITGIVLRSVEIDAVAEAIGAAAAIDPAGCRRHIADRFSHERMVRAYHELYQRLLEGALHERMIGHPAGPGPGANGSGTGARDLPEDAGTGGDWPGTYLAMVAHDVRTPLAAIRGFAETLVHHGADLGPAERDRLLHRIIAISERLDLAARDILDLDQLERGGVELTVDRVSLPSLVEEVLESVDGADHPVEVHLEERTAHADRAALLRVLGNLVANAISHTPEGTRISISSRQEGGATVIAVEDDGPGLDERTVETVHGSGHLSRSPVGGGSGLGLVLVRRLVELHGGRLTARNGETGGASFRVHLPVPAPADQGAARSASRRRDPRGQPSSAGIGSLEVTRRPPHSQHA